MTCTIVSFLPIDLNEQKPGLFPSRFLIKGNPDLEPTITYIEDAKHLVYLDQQRGSIWVTTPAPELSRSIVDDFMTAQQGISDNARPGIFWVEGKLTLDEIQSRHAVLFKTTKEDQFRWFENLCRTADDEYNKNKVHLSVSSFQRRIATIIGWDPEEHEWMTVLPSSIIRCPACSTKVSTTMVVCPNCKCVLDETKFSKLKFAS